ncbi:hypothetical protein SAMN02745146_1808 [Hymenobacter daecheongensis DSM 21074]|uniref:SMI1 / KNR4 family (SUKH-1) n=1 Tax=Hymenobacter daecheongensis DSM 21074 TaxID=1121955 RepID=A0A1M6ETH2_9BACT|nr:SMI1/KNR4 family protein [Hymenobacter daecheongensis]SHI88777.1 hypothetical protein SAMN02745146_1808 [Hymenobacter daecheongensis DSM 21074]
MKGILFTGRSIADAHTFGLLPAYLQDFLRTQNGVVAYFGGLHIRGCCHAPAWHDLGAAWNGEQAFWKRYATVRPTDIPFAQDCVGNQFLLRDDAVLFLDTETGELADLEVDFKHFLFGIEKFPLDALGMEPLRAFQQLGGRLEPGQLLSVYPPVCIQSATEKPQLRPLPALERLAYLADFYAQIKDLPDGQRLHFTLKA